MSDKKCPNCGACKECGAKPQPVFVYPFPPQPSPFWTAPYRPYYQLTSGGTFQATGGSNGYTTSA